MVLFSPRLWYRHSRSSECALESPDIFRGHSCKSSYVLSRSAADSAVQFVRPCFAECCSNGATLRFHDFLDVVIDGIGDWESAVVQDNSEHAHANNSELFHQLAHHVSPCGVRLHD